MPVMLDTDVAIHLRDGSDEVADRLDEAGEALCFSIITRVELENGVYRDPKWTAMRRVALDTLLAGTQTLPFDDETFAAYRAIVETAGYSKPRTNDRMIAATAIVHGLRLITMNGPDYGDIPGLDLEVWPSPAR